MKIKLFGKLIGMLIVFWSAAVMGHSESEAVRMTHEAKNIFDKAISREDYQRADRKYEEALRIFQTLKSEDGLYYCYVSRGLIQRKLGDYQRALEHYEKALALSQRIGDTKREAITLRDIGFIHRSRSQYERALEYYEKALTLCRKISDSNLEASILDFTGSAYTSLGMYHQALEFHAKALQIYRKAGSQIGEASALSNTGLAHRYLGAYDKAMEYYMNALTVAQKGHPVGSNASILDNIATVHSLTGNYEKAYETYQRALSARKKFGDVQGEGVTLNNIGRVHYFRGEFAAALEKYDNALTIFVKIGDMREEGNTLKNKGLVYTARGEHGPALEMYERSLDISRKIGDVRVEGINLTSMGRVYYYLGEYSKALDLFEKSSTIFRNIGDVTEEGLTLDYMGQLYSSWGQHAKALSVYNNSLDMAKKIGSRNLEGASLTNIGATYLQMGRVDDALHNFRESMRLNKTIGVPTEGVNDRIGNLYLDMGQIAEAEGFVLEAGSESSLGRLSLLKSDYPGAKSHYEKALSGAEKSRNSDDLFCAYMGLGQVCEASEDYIVAKDYYEKGMRLIEEIRSGLMPSERKNFFEVKIKGFHRSDAAKGITRVEMKLNQGSNSIDSSEVTRARAFSDNISQRSRGGYAGIARDVLEKEEVLASRVAALRKELSQTDKDTQLARYENLQKAIKSSESDLRAFVEVLWKQNPAYAAIKYPRPVSLKESALKSGECAVIFDVSSQGVGVKLVRNKQIMETFFKKWDKKDLENDVKKFREPFEKLRFNEFDPELGKTLYKKLLLRVLVDLPKGTPLVIVPDGILALLPFEALVTGGNVNWKKSAYGIDNPEGLSYLGDEHPISYYQSITALTLVRTMGNSDKPKDKLLVIADPVFAMKDDRAQQAGSANLSERDKEKNIQLMRTIEDVSQGALSFGRLPETGVLAENLSKMFGANCVSLTGLLANKEDFLNRIAPQMEQFGNIIFATHGVMSTHIPGLMEPFLALSMTPPGTDGFLKMSDILSLKMNADVVALTACQSGLGQELSGEGVMSMGRAFQYIGSKSVLMSLWAVEEKSAVALAEKFFKYRKDGKSKLESLKAARDDIRNSGFGHPFFWSAFILVGETD